MAIRSRKNQYLGINPHLHSYLQHESGGWESFHSDHITHLRDLMEAQLPSHYYVRTEKSLQIRAYDPTTDGAKRILIIPDVGVFRDATSATTTSTAVGNASAPTATFPVAETIEVEEFLEALVVYQVAEAGEDVPVTRIELLSPTNKPPKADYRAYVVKRKDTLESGICLVELDYLHESRSPILRLPSYPAHDPAAYPYSIVLNDPRPSLDEGLTSVYGFSVDDPIPVVPVPLSGEEKLIFDFGAAYNYTFSANRFFTTRVVDYAQKPQRIDRYDEADQQRIQQRMWLVAEAAERGDDLEQGPFPIESVE